jgi:nucleotide-binding universal stress UspA family protein
MYKKILAALDVESRSDRPIVSAERLAREQQAELHAVAVVRSALLATKGFFTAEIVDRNAIIEEARNALQSRLAATCGTQPRAEVLVGKPSEAIVSVARHRGCDLIVLGAKPRAGSERFLGTTATNILRLASGIDLYACHRGDPEMPVERITVAIDGSALSSHVLAAARNLTRSRTDCQVQVVCVVEDESRESEAILAAARRYLQDSDWSDLRVCVESGGVVGTLEHAIRDLDSDLLMIGSGRHRGLGWSIRSTTNSLLHEVSCDVLVVRG